MREAIIIGFAGSVGSGKTTIINKIHDRWPFDTIVVSELMRKKKIVSIDRLRGNPEKYLDVQEEIIKRKIQEEMDWAAYCETKVVLFDRTLADSLFYLTHYLRMSDLKPKSQKRYSDLVSLVVDYLRNKAVYTHVFVCKPLKFINKDRYRPKNHELTQEVESAMISILASRFFANRFHVHTIKDEAMIMGNMERFVKSL